MPRFSSVILAVIFLFSCQPSQKEKKDIDFDKEDQEVPALPPSTDYVKKAKFLFYNMSSPIEMAKIFENSGSSFNEEILLDYNKHKDYLSSKKIALVMGIYGVDLSYARMYNQSQTSIKYFAAIKKLAEKLGVPENYVSLTASNIDNNISNRDSLFRIANEAYLAANTYLKGNERESTASLILMGGWIESIYIATSVFNAENPNNDLIKKIAEQKYSLNSLITLLRNDAEDEEINEYISLLNLLKDEFQHFNMHYYKDEIEIDTLNQKVTISTGDPNIHPYHIDSIRKTVIKIRDRITL